MYTADDVQAFLSRKGKGSRAHTPLAKVSADGETRKAETELQWRATAVVALSTTFGIAPKAKEKALSQALSPKLWRTKADRPSSLHHGQTLTLCLTPLWSSHCKVLSSPETNRTTVDLRFPCSPCLLRVSRDRVGLLETPLSGHLQPGHLPCRHSLRCQIQTPCLLMIRGSDRPSGCRFQTQSPTATLSVPRWDFLARTGRQLR